MKTKLTLLAALAAAILSASAQTSITDSNGTITIPSTPPSFPTNDLKKAAGFSPIVDFGLGLLPYWHKDLTNTFAAKELELEVAPLWKASSAAGSTPYLSIGATYFAWRNLGIGAEAVSFGNGAGSSDLDSAHVLLVPRKDVGNIAGYLLLGGGRDFGRNLYDAEFGVGLTMRYDNGIGVFADYRYVKFIDISKGFSAGGDHAQALRIGITAHF